MTQKSRLTTAKATEMVERIEALQREITEIYISANRDFVGRGNSNVLRDAVKERAAEREAAFMAGVYLGSFDAEIADDEQAGN